MFGNVRHKPDPVSYMAGYLPPEPFGNLPAPWFWSRPSSGRSNGRISAKLCCRLELWSCGSRLWWNDSSWTGNLKFRSPAVRPRPPATTINESSSVSSSGAGRPSTGCDVTVIILGWSSALQDGSDPFHAPTSCPRKLLSSARFDAGCPLRGAPLDPLPPTWPGTPYDKRGSFQPSETSNS